MSTIDFVPLHNCSKHIIHLSEAVNSTLMVADAIISRLSAHSPTHSPMRDQLLEALRYRQSVFHSTRLRLGSLRERTDTATALLFNLVTQQDSMAIMQDSSTLKAIAIITIIFLPTTGVATVVGSQLFVSNPPGADGVWEVLVTPLFKWLWWVSIPLTLLVLLSTYAWNYWTHRGGLPALPVVVVQFVEGVRRRATTLRSSSSESESLQLSKLS